MTAAHYRELTQKRFGSGDRKPVSIDRFDTSLLPATGQNSSDICHLAMPDRACLCEGLGMLVYRFQSRGHDKIEFVPQVHA